MPKRRFFPLFLFLLFVFPASTNYSLHDFGFGSGGVRNTTSTNYSLHAISGEVDGSQLSGTTYDLGPGLIFTRAANTPPAPTFQNDGTDYNRLRFILNIGGNPSDTLFAIAISTDNFAAETNYIKSDNTVGTTLALSDYQSYTDWGNGTGEYVIGLEPGTTYYIKVKALQGRFTETGYGPVASASTSAPTLTYDIDISASDEETAPPYALNVGTLTAGSVVTGTQRIWVDLNTNGLGGGFVYVYDTNSGLYSTSSDYTITSASDNLTSASEGFGLQSASVSQSSGGPLAAVSPYDGASENVGIVSPTSRTAFSSSSSPITGGRGSLYVKAKASTTTPAAGDYADVITLIASATF